MNDMAEKALNKKMEMLENEIVDLTAKIQVIDDKLSNPIKLNETKEEFLNIVKMLGFKMRNGNPAEKDNLARIMLLNIHIYGQKRVTFTWKEPFDSLLKAKTVQPGATEQVVFEPPRIAAHALFTLKNPDMFIIKDTPIEVLKREAEVIDYIL